MPVPATPLRGEGIVPLTFDDYVRARLVAKLAKLLDHSEKWRPVARRIIASVRPEVMALYLTHGAFRCKPHRNSVGCIWKNEAYWWLLKGYYRPGWTDRHRPPLQHLIWADRTGSAVPAGHEIFLLNRDAHDLRFENMALLPKEEVHRRIHRLGENVQLHNEHIAFNRQRWATRHSRDLTALLLDKFKNGNSQPKEKNVLNQLRQRDPVRPAH